METLLDQINWIDQAKNMEKWLQDIHFPFKNPKDMIHYIENKDPSLFNHMIVQTDPGELPQSYAHWWCYMRIGRRETPAKTQPLYPTYEKWHNVNNAWNKTNLSAETKTMDNPTTNGASIFAMFTCWLDMLYIDSVLYADERTRTNIPRLYGDKILWENNGQTPKSRKETTRYILQQSNEIFYERGFKQGLAYWQKYTQKYLN